VQPGGSPGLPTGYKVQRVLRVENARMWHRYEERMAAIHAKRSGKKLDQFDPPVLTANITKSSEHLLSPLNKDLNEVYLFHGTTVNAAMRIAQADFNLQLAGSGNGTMYGNGLYLSENSTKADEYARDESKGDFHGVFAMIVARACMGKMYYTEQRDEQAFEEVSSGQHDSCLGDRLKAAQTFREFVVYDADQVYPEYVIFYTRTYAGESQTEMDIRGAAIRSNVHLPLYFYRMDDIRGDANPVIGTWHLNPTCQPYVGAWIKSPAKFSTEVEAAFQQYLFHGSPEQVQIGDTSEFAEWNHSKAVCVLDFKLLTVSVIVLSEWGDTTTLVDNNPVFKLSNQKGPDPDKISSGGKRLSFQLLQRTDAMSGCVTHPETDSPHPWYEHKVGRVETSGGGGDWLTTRFFFECFQKAVVKAGGALDFDEKELFNYQFNEDFRKAEKALTRRGGVLYEVPSGWKRFALNVRGKYPDGDTWMQMDGKPGEWAVAYHGTKFDAVPKIIRGGFKIGPRQGAEWCKLSDTRTSRPIGKGIYCTPNLKVVECYANGEEAQTGTPPVKIEGHTLFFVLQCRVRPGAIRRPNNHVYTKTNNDEEVMGIDGVFEWVVEDPADIRPYAVLIRDKESIAHHDKLGDVAGYFARHSKPPPGSFDHVQGKIAPDAQAAAEQRQLKARGASPSSPKPEIAPPPRPPGVPPLWRSRPEKRHVVPCNSEGCGCLPGRPGGLRISGRSEVPAVLEAKGLTEAIWADWLGPRLQGVQKLHHCLCLPRFVMVLLLIVTWGVAAIPLTLVCGWICWSWLDPFQWAMAKWLRDFNVILHPMGIYVKVFTFKQMGGNGKKHEKNTLSVICFAYDDAEIRKIKASPVLQPGHSSDPNWGCWCLWCHRGRVV